MASNERADPVLPRGRLRRGGPAATSTSGPSGRYEDIVPDGSCSGPTSTPSAPGAPSRQLRRVARAASAGPSARRTPAGSPSGSGRSCDRGQHQRAASGHGSSTPTGPGARGSSQSRNPSVLPLKIGRRMALPERAPQHPVHHRPARQTSSQIEGVRARQHHRPGLRRTSTRSPIARRRSALGHRPGTVAAAPSPVRGTGESSSV